MEKVHEKTLSEQAHDISCKGEEDFLEK